MQRGGARRSSIAVGVDYLAVCDAAADRGDVIAAQAATGIREVLAGDRAEFLMDYPCATPEDTRWYMLRAVSTGLDQGAMVSHVDVTELRDVERSVREQSYKLWRVVEPEAEFMTLLDADGTVIEGFPAHERMLGPRPWIGEAAFDVVHPRDRDTAAEIFARCSTIPGRVETATIRVGDTSGRWRRLELIARNLLEDPEVGGVVVSGRDVTDRTEAHVTRLLWDQLLDDLPAATIITDDAGIVLAWNARSSELLDRSAEEMVGHDFAEMLGWPRWKTLGPLLDQVRRDGRWSGEVQLTDLGASLRERAIWLQLQRLDEAESGLSGYLAVAVDRTDEQRMRDTLVFREHHDSPCGSATARASSTVCQRSSTRRPADRTA